MSAPLSRKLSSKYLPPGSLSTLISLLRGGTLRDSGGGWYFERATKPSDDRVIERLAQDGLVDIVDDDPNRRCNVTRFGEEAVYDLIREAQATPIDAAFRPAHNKSTMD
jgi:hypothetical protein